MSNQKIEKPNHKITAILLVLSIAILGFGSFASITITRKKFLEDFNRMNGFYKQTLFLTGQSKRDEAKNQYNSLVGAYMEFQNKYQVYRPYVIRNDGKFSEDLANVSSVIISVKDGVYTGDLPETHKKLELIRPIFQEMFKRNGFSMLSMALVDFHDIMEKLITAADGKDAKQLLEVYPEANSALQIIEKEDTSSDIQVIRKNLDDLRNIAESGQIEKLSAKAAELKAGFIKVYLQKG
jgi:hypothetical protein